MTSKLVLALATRFLSLKLPATVRPDGVDGERVGTNLLTANEAAEVFEGILSRLAEDAEQWRYACLLGIITHKDEEVIARSRGLPVSIPVIGRNGVKDIADDPKGFAEAMRAHYKDSAS
jgi:hypothetical protein